MLCTARVPRGVVRPHSRRRLRLPQWERPAIFLPDGRVSGEPGRGNSPVSPNGLRSGSFITQRPADAHILLRGEVRWRPLLPTAVLTGIGVWLYAAAGSVWMPVTVTHNFEQFGTFGIALSFVSWFTGMAFLLVIAAAGGPDAENAHRRRGTPLPGPARRVRLADAFGRGARGSVVDPHTGSADPGS